MVPAEAKAARGRAKLVAYTGPLRWLCNRVQDFRRCIQDWNLLEFQGALDSLGDCPELFSTAVSLKEGLQDIRVAA
eukprot:5279185-Pyramimonas_sp.AAC.1